MTFGFLKNLEAWTDSRKYRRDAPTKSDKPRVLHVWDQAGVACILAKWLRKADYYSLVVSKSSPIIDPFHFMDFYDELGVPTTHDALFLNVVHKAAKDAEIIHIHSLPELVPKFKKMGKRVVVHYHGTELATGKYNREGDKQADLIFVTTKNLLEYHSRAIYLPNPIDTDHFKPSGQKGKGYFTFKIRYLDMDKLHLSFPYTIVDRDKTQLSYEKMPSFLNQWEGYIDIKYDVDYGELVRASSKTGLEALACGLQVYTWEQKWAVGLPDEHRPEKVVDSLIRHYQSIL